MGWRDQEAWTHLTVEQWQVGHGHTNTGLWRSGGTESANMVGFFG